MKDKAMGWIPEALSKENLSEGKKNSLIWLNRNGPIPTGWLQKGDEDGYLKTALKVGGYILSILPLLALAGIRKALGKIGNEIKSIQVIFQKQPEEPQNPSSSGWCRSS